MSGSGFNARLIIPCNKTTSMPRPTQLSNTLSAPPGGRPILGFPRGSTTEAGAPLLVLQRRAPVLTVEQLRFSHNQVKEC